MHPTLNALYYGDCLEWMREWDDQTVDLVYLDPPFNSQSNYNVLFGKTVGGAQYRAFTDTWHWDADAAERMDAYRSAIARPAHAAIVGLYSILGPSGMLSYLTYMAERLEHCHRLLKTTGGLYLHCDPTAGHYLKILLDGIFGAANFRNQIVWERSGVKGTRGPTRTFGTVTDLVLFYAKPQHVVTIPRVRKETPGMRPFKHRDEQGVYRAVADLYSDAGLHASPKYEWNGHNPPHGWRVSRANLKRLHAENRIHYNANNKPFRKQYRDEWDGVAVSNLWSDIPVALGKERLGYATQKPRALLERVIAASSPRDGVVLDPFCGCGTTVEAAHKLGRPWLGVDISPFAIDVIRDRRLQDPSIPAYGIPYDLAGASKLAAERPFAFETCAVTRLNGFVPNTKQVADGGVDGRGTVWEQPEADVTRLALAQVKGGAFSLGNLRDFNHVIARDRAALGCYLTVDRVDTHAARTETAGMGTIQVGGMAYPRMQRWSMADYFNQLPPVLPLMADPYTGKPMQMRLV